MVRLFKKYLLNSVIFFVILLINVTYASQNNLQVSVINVGQADSIIVQTPHEKNMLIDAGDLESFTTIDSCLKELEIKRLDVIIGTHPHADHVGSMAAVIRKYEIGQIFMPKVLTYTRTFEDLLISIKEKGLKVNTAKAGEIIALDPEIKISILAPNSSHYENLNDYSVVLKISYGKTSFLLAGDASIISENEMINAGYNLKADILKVGHHGSNSSSSIDFLSNVNPKYAIISVGKDNSYGHPGKFTLGRLKDLGVQVFRTDQDGSLLIISDGETIRIDKQASPIKPNAPPQQTSSIQSQNENQSENISTTVYVTRTGHKYHQIGCRYLRRSSISISLKDAKNAGYGPCSVCNPPQ